MDAVMLFLNTINKTEIFLPLELQKLLEIFESHSTGSGQASEEIWKSSDRALFRRAEILEEKIDRFFAIRAKIDPEKEWKIIEKEHINILTFHDKAYPHSLRDIPDPPPILYVKGRMNEDAPIVAIVGTRKFSLYGKQVATELATELTNAGVIIISGLARGIDAFAHTACVERANPTIAVLGSGIDDKSIYPPENLNLAKRIIETGGAIISEFSPGAEPYQSHFPQRNRIVSALSLGTIVIEAPLKSGALITAKFALEQGKEVFAIPGPINSINSEGTNYLIKQGAHPVTSVDDVLEVLNFKFPISNLKSQIKNLKLENMTEEEEKVLEVIGRGAVHIDKIVEETRMPISTVSSALTTLEMKNMIVHAGNNFYAIKKA